MDRLTKRAEYNCACWNGNQDYTTHKRYLELLDRLSAYEDTGLTPEEVQNLAVKWQGKELNQHIRGLLRAEQEGRLVILQRKPNDAYYHRNYDTGELELNIELHGGDPDGQYPEIDSCASWE